MCVCVYGLVRTHECVRACVRAYIFHAVPVCVCMPHLGFEIGSSSTVHVTGYLTSMLRPGAGNINLVKALHENKGENSDEIQSMLKNQRSLSAHSAVGRWTVDSTQLLRRSAIR